MFHLSVSLIESRLPRAHVEVWAEFCRKEVPAAWRLCAMNVMPPGQREPQCRGSVVSVPQEGDFQVYQHSVLR